nr:MAG TPA: hypothetical protein [Caudoviricetes sp.]
MKKQVEYFISVTLIEEAPSSITLVIEVLLMR